MPADDNLPWAKTPDQHAKSCWFLRAATATAKKSIVHKKFFDWTAGRYKAFDWCRRT